ncbi:hypothetical protein D3C73_1658700 [compost metagenome]
MHALDGGRQILKPGDNRLIVLDRVSEEVRVGVDIRFDHHVALRNGTAGENLAFIPLHIHQGE